MATDSIRSRYGAVIVGSLCAALPAFGVDGPEPPPVERAVGIRLPRELRAARWIPEAQQPCDPERPAAIVVVRTEDAFGAVQGCISAVERLVRNKSACIVVVSPDSPARVRRWLDKRRLSRPIGAGAGWSRRLDRGRGVELYLWFPRPRELYRLRLASLATGGGEEASSDSAGDAFLQSLAERAGRNANARAWDFADFKLLAQLLPFQELQDLERRIEQSRPPAGVEAAGTRASWWFSLRWIMAHADPAISDSALAAYIRRPMAPELEPHLRQLALATAASLPADELAARYQAALQDDGPVTLAVRDLVIEALEQRSADDVERVVQHVATLETNPWLRSRLAYRYLWSVRPDQPEQLRFLKDWRARLPYYDRTACLIDSYLHALESGADPFKPSPADSTAEGEP